MDDKKSILTVVVPAYNESENLSLYLPPLLEFCRQEAWKVIIVDDGSMDNTKDVLLGFSKKAGLAIIRHKLNKGYGAALKSGICEANTDFVITIDADGQHIPEDIGVLLKKIMDSDADMVVGSRDSAKRTTWFRSFGKWLIRRIAKILLPLSIRDLNSGMKIYRTDLAKQYIEICPDSMAFSDVITLLFISQKHLVHEVPITIRERAAGVSTIGVQTAFDTVLEIINIVMLFNPLKIFLPISVLLWIAGIVTTIPPIVKGRGISVAGSMMIMVGTLCFLLGLVAEQLSTLRKGRLH